MTAYLWLGICTVCAGVLLRIGWEALPFLERVAGWILMAVWLVLQWVFSMAFAAATAVILAVTLAGERSFALGKGRRAGK